LNSRSKIDYREVLIPKRLKTIKYILLVASGKGGVGKSLVSATTALILAKNGLSVGLLDLDFHGPSSSVIYGDLEMPSEEEEGLIPPVVEGVKVMSIDQFVEGRPIPVSGKEKREIIKELLALTHWGETDVLVVDMPPETGDVLLASLTYLRGRRGVILVTTPSKLSLKVVDRLIRLLNETGVEIIGIIENMSRLELQDNKVSPFGVDAAKDLASRYNIHFLGSLPIDPEASLYADEGRADKITSTRFGLELEKCLKKTTLLD